MEPQLLLNRQLKLVQINPAAQRLLAAEAAVLQLQDRQLLAPQEPRALARCLHLACRGSPSAMLLPRPGRLGLTLSAEPCGPHSLPWLRIRISDPESLSPDRSLLQELFDLDELESRLAVALAQGRDPTAVLVALNLSPQALHMHTEQLLRKCRVDHVTQLVVLILHSVAMRPASPERRDTPPPSHERTRLSAAPGALGTAPARLYEEALAMASR